MVRATRFLSRSTVGFISVWVLLVACGPDRGESDSPNTEADSATAPTAPTQTVPATPAVPTAAVVDAYCDAFAMRVSALRGEDKAGDAAEKLDEILHLQRTVGTPENMPEKTRDVFIEHMRNGADVVSTLRKLPEDSPASTVDRGKTPAELLDYSAKNCP